MKPADHPNFFRFPPPEGRSRESSIVLDEQGRWFHDGAPVTHARLALSFARWLTRHPDDGRAIVSNGHDWCYVAVKGADCFVSALHPRSDGSLQLTLFDDSSELLDPASLQVDAEGVLQCTVSNGRVARFMRRAQLSIAACLVNEEPPIVEVAGQRYRIRATEPV